MKIYLTGFVLIWLTALTNSATAAPDGKGQPLRPVPALDLARYAGTWYEIARLPNRFQSMCAGEVTATYRLLPGGEIEVINRCTAPDGTLKEAKGKARRAGKQTPASVLKVRFAPAWLSFLPMVWGDYWVIALDGEYRMAVIGEPGRKYLWLLSRTPSLPEDEVRRLLQQAAEQGYDISKVIRTRQQGPPAGAQQ